MSQNPVIDPGVLFQFPEDFGDEVNSGWPQITVDKDGVVEVQAKYTRLNNVIVKPQTGSQNQLPQGTLALASGPWVVASSLLEVEIFALSFFPHLISKAGVHVSSKTSNPAKLSPWFCIEGNMRSG